MHELSLQITFDVIGYLLAFGVLLELITRGLTRETRAWLRPAIAIVAISAVGIAGSFEYPIHTRPLFYGAAGVVGLILECILTALQRRRRENGLDARELQQKLARISHTVAE